MTARIRLSPEGPEVSRFAHGAWRMLDDPEGSDPERIRTRIEACLDLGITSFDHAAVYGDHRCEAAFGAALARAPELRKRIEIITKCGICAPGATRPQTRVAHYDLGERAILASVRRSLEQLHTDYVDVLLLHRPSPLMHPDEVAAALSALRSAGMIRFAGVSNFSPAQFELIQSRLDFPLVTNQIEVSLLQTAPMFDGSLDQLLQRRLRPMAWSPVAGGRLFTSDDERARRVRLALEELAPRYAASPEQLAYAWLLAHPSGMQIVAGSNRIARIRAAASSERVRFDIQDWFALLKAARGADVD